MAYNVSMPLNPKTDGCPLCGSKEAETYQIDADMFRIICPICAEYLVSWEFLRYLEPSELQRIGYILSGRSRELKETGGEYPTYLVTNAKELSSSYPVPDVDDVKAKAEKLLQRLRERSKFFGDCLQIDYRQDFPLGYAKNYEELIALMELLEGLGLLDIKSKDTASYLVTLTASGWDMVRELKGVNRSTTRAFIAAWFDDRMNASIDAIGGAITDAGYHPVCIRDEHFSEKIMDKALGEIRRSRFVVADLTGNRNSVFFEAGFAHGLGIDTIYVFDQNADPENRALEFYVRHYQCYGYKNPEELKERTVDAIRARIK